MSNTENIKRNLRNADVDNQCEKDQSFGFNITSMH